MKLKWVALLWLTPGMVFLVSIFFAVFVIRGAATLGATWNIHGEIRWIEPNGATDRAGGQEGDVILQFDGCEVPDYDRCSIHLLRPSDQVVITIQREEQTLIYSLIAEPLTREERLVLMSLLFLAFIFCLSGLIILFRRPDALPMRLYYIICMIATLALTASAIVYSAIPYGPTWLHLFNGILTPVLLQFHALFPEPKKSAQKRWLWWILYTIGLALGLFRCLRPWISFPSIPTMNAIMHIWTSIGVAGAIALLLHTYLRTSSAFSRQRIRLITFGALVGFGPILLLFAAPTSGFGADAFMRLPIAIPLIGAVPVTYSISIWRTCLVKFDWALHRFLVHAVAGFVIFGAYFTALIIFAHYLPENIAGRAALGAMIALIAAFTFQPLRNLIGRFVDKIFYGGWYDHRQIIDKFGERLVNTDAYSAVIDILCRQIPSALNLPQASLWLRKEAEGELELVAGPPIHLNWPQGSPAAYVMVLEPYLVIPLLGKDSIFGIWALQGRARGDWTPEDRNTFTALSRESALALIRIQLVEKLQAKIAEIEQAHRRLWSVREEERTELSSELSDGIIQDLVGFRYRLENLQEKNGRSRQVGEIHTQVGMLIDELRRLSSNLRPPSLDQLGLATALRTLAREITLRGLPVEASLEDIPLPDEVAIGLYRISQEALANAWRHAQANSVGLCLYQEANEVILVIADDGLGFDVALAQRQAKGLGLVSMAERAQAIGAHLVIDSKLGEGTKVTVKCDENIPVYTPSIS